MNPPKKGPPRKTTLDALWARHDVKWRDPQQIVAQELWCRLPACTPLASSTHALPVQAGCLHHKGNPEDCPTEVDPRILAHRVQGRFWETLAETGQTLIVTREYEHLVMALCAGGGRPRISYLSLPHPNGLAVDARRQIVHVASTRNPNVIYDFAPCRGLVERDGPRGPAGLENTLLPLRCRYLPGCAYIHDLALIGCRLHANAVAMNAVVELPGCGGFKAVWWPCCIDGAGKPLFGRNHLQLNSIAAGKTLRSSFFTASAAQPSARRPGSLDFPVDKRGVVFSGRTREAVATGLTRPHSARLLGSEVWLDNSGYGEVGRIAGGRFEAVARLPGWTRGLCFGKGVAFVGSSRVIPRFRHYAPGIDCDRSQTGIHALDLKTGRWLGSIVWPLGNQIFALALSGGICTPGFPFTAGKKNDRQVQQLFFRGLA
ncbi:MAG: DUF4915 domain-containing protein [Planctomycetota bacterium]